MSAGLAGCPQRQSVETYIGQQRGCRFQRRNNIKAPILCWNGGFYVGSERVPSNNLVPCAMWPSPAM